MTDFLARMVLRSLAARFRRSLVTVLAVTLAVTSLVVLDALMVGVSDAMVRNTVAVRTGHVLATGALGTDARELAHRVDALGGVAAALPRRSADGELYAVRTSASAVVGVDPDAERGRSVVPARMIAGDFLGHPGSIVLGESQAEALGARLGDEVRFAAAGRERVFRIAGVFRTHVEHLDRRTAFVRVDELDGPVTELAVFLSNPQAADDAAASVRAMLPEGTSVVTWRDLLPELVQILALNRVSMNIVLILATVILAMGVSNATFISVSERTREFGVLKAMGMRPATIAMLVTAEAAGLAIIGAAAGLAVGACAAAVWSRAGLDLSAWTSENVHFLVSGVVYPRLAARALVLPFVAATAFAVASALLPAMRAARVRAVEALRWI